MLLEMRIGSGFSGAFAVGKTGVWKLRMVWAGDKCFMVPKSVTDDMRV
jgi:hypothetical protein